MRTSALFPLILLALSGLTDPAAGLQGRFEADGAALVLKLNDGRVMQGEALVGLRLVLSTGEGDTEVRIDGVDQDEAAIGGPIALYRLTISGSDRTPGNFCEPDPKGRRAGFPIPDGTGGFAFTCTSGAEGKCVLMGYRPWEIKAGVPLRELHRACIRMLRADYGGDDRPSTRNGTLVDIYDRFGIQKADLVPGLDFEAAWGPDGAVCVAHPRIADKIGLADLALRYPRLSDRLGPEICTEEAMRADPRALLFNRSAGTAPGR
jgi:ADYC domain